MLSSVNLFNEHDKIVWRWTPNGKYSVSSAYECQFRGVISLFLAMDIWRARAEPKCKFFVWLALHNRILTADNMVKRNWDCNPTCPLCYCQSETAEHLLCAYNYTEALWCSIANRFSLPDYTLMTSRGNPVEWVRFLSSQGDKQHKRKQLGILSTFWWNIWKERNRRIF
jgi:hypothetical protein